MSDEQATANAAELKVKQDEADKVNTARGNTVGTRVRVGQTRGRNPMVITWEAFDESKPDTLPKGIQNFMEVTKVQDEPTLVSYLIAGHNDAQYTSASDPLKEFVDPTWPDEAQSTFRLVVRNYARTLNLGLEEAVALIKPGFAKQFTKPVA